MQRTLMDDWLTEEMEVHKNESSAFPRKALVESIDVDSGEEDSLCRFTVDWCKKASMVVVWSARGEDGQVSRFCCETIGSVASGARKVVSRRSTSGVCGL